MKTRLLVLVAGAATLAITLAKAVIGPIHNYFPFH